MAEFKTWKRKKRKKPDRRAMTASELGRMGAAALFAKYTLEDRQEWGHKGGSSTLRRYGKDFYRRLSAMGRKAKKAKAPRRVDSRDKLFHKLKVRTKRGTSKPGVG